MHCQTIYRSLDQFHVYDTLVIFDHLTDEIAVFHTNIEAEEVDLISTHLSTNYLRFRP